MNVISLLLFFLVLLQQSTGKVETTFDKKADFNALRTYSWTPGYNADMPEVHKLIVAACEAEMTGLGFTKAPTGNADVTLAYYTVRSTDTDVDALEKMQREGRTGPAPTKILGRLLVVLRAGTSDRRLWTASTREQVDPDPAKLRETIRTTTARLFETYPGRKPSRQ